MPAYRKSLRIATRLADARARSADRTRGFCVEYHQRMRSLRPALRHARHHLDRRHRVAFFAGCVGSLVFGPVNEATVRVLTRNGFDVHTLASEPCCGAMASPRSPARAWRTASAP